MTKIIKDLDLTVIVPIYNSVNTLERALLSVIDHCHNVSFEILCIDDGSCDDSWDTLELLSNKYHQLKLIKQNRQGPAVARNVGISQARGHYIAFIDADDYTTANFSELIDFIDREHADIVQFGFYQETPDGEILTIHQLPSHTYYSGKECFTFLYQHQYGHGCWGAIYRKDFLLAESLIFPVISHYEDAAFFRNVIITSKKTVFVPDVYYHYVRYESSRSNEWNVKNLKEFCSIYQEHLDALTIEGHDLDCEDAACFIQTLRSFSDDNCADLLIKYLSSLLNDNQSVVIYGIGSSGFRLATLLQKIGVKCYFCESNDSRIGQTISNVPVISTSQLKKNNDFKIIIGSCFIHDIYSVLQNENITHHIVLPKLTGLIHTVFDGDY